VTGVNGLFGGLDQIAAGSSFSHQFADEGVYPYYCYLHAGMAGAVVVGDAVGAVANGESVSLIGSAQLERPSAAVTSTSDSGFDSLWLIIPLAAATAIAMAAAGGFALGTRHARS
jgi:hypothetical protein